MIRLRRKKSINAAALRKECAQLRYVSAFADLSLQSEPDLRALLDRARRVLDGLELLVFAHDDSRERLAFVTIGVAGAAYAIATLSGVGSIVAAAIGAGVALRDAAKLVETRLLLKQDEESFLIIELLFNQLVAEFRRRGRIYP